MTLIVGSLFSGIGGIDLGLERAGMRVVWQAETDLYASKVLAKHWPEVPNLGDVTTIDWSAVERPDLVCGGYPCQPFSFAGRRAGIDDTRHLWPRFAGALRILRPRWVLLENVPGHLSLGFDEVLADLAALGFDAEWELLPAAAFGAPHLRYRLFVVAYAQCDELWEQSESEFGGGSPSFLGDDGATGHVADTAGQRHRVSELRHQRRLSTQPDQGSVLADANRPGLPVFQRGETSAERSRFRAPGDSGWWRIEPDVGRVAHGIPSRVDRLRCLGNAVVPQVAEYVGRLIVEAEKAA